MHRGNIKIFRKIIGNTVYKDSIMFHILIHLLLNAKTKETKEHFKGHDFSLNAGQLIVTSQQVADDIGINKIMAYRKLLSLQDLNIIKLEPQSHCCIVTILKYEEYQGKQSKIEDDHVLTTEELNVVMRNWGKVQPHSFKFNGKWSAAMVCKTRDRLENKTFKEVRSYLAMNRIFLTDELFCEQEVDEADSELDDKRKFLMNRRKF